VLRLRGFQALIAQSLWKDLSLPWPYFSCRFAGRKGSLQQLGTGVHSLTYIRLGHVEADICREKRSNIVSISSSSSQMILIPFKVFESKAKPSNQHTLSFKLGQYMTWHSKKSYVTRFYMFQACFGWLLRLRLKLRGTLVFASA